MPTKKAVRKITEEVFICTVIAALDTGTAAVMDTATAAHSL